MHYLQPDDYYYYEHTCDVTQCQDCETKSRQIQVASDHLYALINILYSPKSLNMANLRETLDELCHCLDIDMPVGNPNIARA